MERKLYRDSVNGKIGGVCAGIAQYLHLEIWIVRIVAVSAFLLGFGFIAVIAYIAAMLLIDKKPETLGHFNNELHVKEKPWQQGKPAQVVLFELDQEIRRLEQKVENIEVYATSREFELNRQFKQL